MPGRCALASAVWRRTAFAFAHACTATTRPMLCVCPFLVYPGNQKEIGSLIVTLARPSSREFFCEWPLGIPVLKKSWGWESLSQNGCDFQQFRAISIYTSICLRICFISPAVFFLKGIYDYCIFFLRLKRTEVLVSLPWSFLVGPFPRTLRPLPSHRAYRTLRRPGPSSGPPPPEWSWRNRHHTSHT